MLDQDGANFLLKELDGFRSGLRRVCRNAVRGKQATQYCGAEELSQSRTKFE